MKVKAISQDHVTSRRDTQELPDHSASQDHVTGRRDTQALLDLSTPQDYVTGRRDTQALLDLSTPQDYVRSEQDTQTQALTERMKKRSLSPSQQSWQCFRRNIRAMVSVGTIIFLIVLALAGQPIYKHIGGTVSSDFGGPIGPEIYHSYDHEELSQQNQGPSVHYWLGTDTLGRDLLARLMQGLLISLIVAVLVEIVSVSLGVMIGLLAGYYGGWIDMVLARFTDLISAFPGLLFAILLTGIFGPTANDYFTKLPVIGSFLDNGNGSLIIIAFALALLSWPLMARYVRAQTLQIKSQLFIEAARSVGTSDLRIMIRHILPNLLSFVIIAATLDIANTIISEAGLSSLGLGIIPPGSSLGLMIANGTPVLELDPWNALLPTLTLTIIVLAISFIGDGLRDAFDPRSNDF